MTHNAMRKTLIAPASIGAALLALAGCEVGPDYKPPEVKVNNAFGELSRQAAAGSTTQPSLATSRPTPLVEWWTTFHDPELDSLVERAAKGSLTLQQAASRIRESRRQRGVVGTGLFPQVNAQAGTLSARGSKNVTFPASAFGGGGSSSGGGGSGGTSTSAIRSNANPTLHPDAAGSGAAQGVGQAGPPGVPQSVLGGGGLPGVQTDLYQAGFDASWEIDVFGGQRRQIEAADADQQAAIEDRRDLLVRLIAEVARNYIELRGYQRQAAIARDNLATQVDTLDLTRSKFKAGFATELDVDRQAAEVATTAAELPTFEAAVRRNIHALGTLLGGDPESLSGELSADAPIPPVPPEIPVGMPSDLLRRRPDVRRAERQIAAAAARVGVATADLYPKFTLTGTFGLDTTSSLKHFLDWNSRYYSIGPGISWNLFDAGRIRNNIGVFSEEQQQSVSGYQQTVLDALREVEDSLVNYRTEQTRRKALADAVDASRAAVDLAKQQYQQGVIDFLTVLDAQRSLLAAQDALARSDREISTDFVALYKALGGGWEIEQRPG